MKGREEQIQGKMDEVRRQQEESVERREQLLQELDAVSQLTRREQQDVEARKAARKQQLEAQVSWAAWPGVSTGNVVWVTWVGTGELGCMARG